MNPRLIAAALLAAGWVLTAIAQGMFKSETGDEG